MEYRLIITLACLVLSLQVIAKPITIYTSEPIKVEEVPKKEPEKPKTENTPIHAIIEAYISAKPVEQKTDKPSTEPPLNVIQKNFPFLYRLKLFYQMLG